MKLIIILLCLWLDHYMHVGSRGRQQQYFNVYENFIKKIFGTSKIFQGPTSLVIIAAPVILIVGVLQLIGMFRSDLVDLLLGVATLLFCLGASPLQYRIEAYLTPKEGKATASETELKDYLKEAGVKTHGGFHRGVTDLILSQSHERLFAIVFWFLILGPIGAITYRLISWFHDNAMHGEAMYDTQLEHMTLVHKYAAWIPARLVALSYTLVGNFMASFDTWLKMAVNPKISQEILVACGDASLGLSATPANTATKAENDAAMHLVQRALLVWVLIIAVATLGQLFL
jgi:membrane protein required for beta-lactamase induction